MRLIYHPDAEAELIEAALFYEGRMPTLGAQFLNVADQALQTIRQAPERWKLIQHDVRRYILHDFPYAVIYRVYPDHVRILAFKHHSREPGYWLSRLDD
jgi:toxin ParE1/3/4